MTSDVIIICARAGSKRLPRKHMQEIGGVTLIERIFQAALPLECDIVFTTDCPEMQSFAQRFSSRILVHNRPLSLADDYTPKALPLREACEWYETHHNNAQLVHGIVSLQANSPEISTDLIIQVLSRLKGKVGEVSTLFPNLEINPAVRAFKRENLFFNFYSVHSAYVISDVIDVHTREDLVRIERKGQLL